MAFFGNKMFEVRWEFLWAGALLGQNVGSIAVAAETQSNPPELKASCQRNYRDTFAVDAGLHFKNGVLIGVLWNTVTDTGHSCGVAYGTLRDAPVTEGEVFSVGPGDDLRDWYLLEPPKGFCVVHIHQSGSQFILQEAYPGACKRYCGANGVFESTVIDTRSKNCGLPRLDKRPSR